MSVFLEISRLAESLFVQVLEWLENIIWQGEKPEILYELIDWSDFWLSLLSAEGMQYLIIVLISNVVLCNI